MKPILLYGPPGAGKTTLGKALAEEIRIPFYDLDTLIEHRQGMTITQIFADLGEPVFRQIERAMLLEVLKQPIGVIAMGGGTLLESANRLDAESASLVIVLTASTDVLLKRIATSDERPLLQGDTEKRLRDLLEHRKEHYASFEYHVDTGMHSPQAVLDRILALVPREHGGFSGGLSYPVRVGADVLERLPELIGEEFKNEIVFLVTDTNVAPLHADRVREQLVSAGFTVQLAVLPAGEKYKNIQAVQGLWEQFHAAQMGRRGFVLALGGGVVTDIAGFAAATFKRGVGWGAVPTTLLGMVDAAIGGKTGVDLGPAKNIIGAFHDPNFVLVDSAFLNTLPEAELRNGRAEVIKQAVIAAPQILELLKDGQYLTPEKLRIVIDVKINVVRQDPLENGLRQVLNFGHTIGHAVEACSEFTLRHGEAVAIGMVAEARLGEQAGITEVGLADELVSHLQHVGLPTSIPAEMDHEAILSLMGSDKKNVGGAIRFAIPERLGQMHIDVEFPDLEKQFLSLRG